MFKYCTAALVACALVLTGCLAQDGGARKKRPAMVADSFYPSNPDLLARMIDDYLASAKADDLGQVVALIVPHAGYIYSGHVAAQAFAQLKGRQVSRVVIMSPSHVEPFPGASIYDGDAYQTPLGDVPVDTDFARKLAAQNPRFRLSSAGHESKTADGRGEHAIEVQLPFLQRVLGSFKVVPIVFGEQKYETCRNLGVALSKLVNDSSTVIVASSDLSHYHPYADAVAMDKKVVRAISAGDYLGLSRNLGRGTWEACGGGPIVAAMIAAERMDATAKMLAQANSGDAPAGDKTSVVGYAALAFVKNSGPPPATDYSLGEAEQVRLMEIARNSVETAVKQHALYNCSDGGLDALGVERGAFVTLAQKGRLRGCIGYVEPMKPLCQTVRDVAAAAATADQRFLPVAPSELPDLQYEISVLSSLRRVKDIKEIQLGKHGLLVRKGDREGLLLPQVATENKWDLTTLLQQTCQKAGLPANAWQDEEADIFCFTAFVFGKKE
ncbi:MAG: AmmeMemoRadiSam system protein B [Acidobacteria bacterium]|nr:MAG: AmmeMemoRadiSam system protein B [Acidobacteriota bacterium]